MNLFLKNALLASIIMFGMSCSADELDDFDFFGSDNNEFNIDLSDIEAYEQTRGPMTLPVDPTLIALVLSNITSPLWNHTQSPFARNILYHFPHKFAALEKGGVAVNFFFNETNKMPVTVKNLLDVKDFENNFLIQLLPSSMISKEDIVQLIPLFRNITIQERKAGAFIQFGATKGPFTIQLHTSLLLAERNLWINSSGQQEIKSILAKNFPGAAFDDDEGLIIRYGMGDTRIKLGINSLNMTNFQTDVGFEAILPTGNLSRGPTISVNVDKIAGAVDSDTLVTNAVSILQNIRNYLLNAPLGNNGHYGLGVYFESKIGIFHDIATIWMRASYDKLFDGYEDRLIMFNQVLKPEDLLMVTPDNPNNGNIINDYMKQYIFPSSFKCLVSPGGVFNFITSVSCNIDSWSVAVGYDFYAQQQEFIRTINNPSVSITDLRIKDAESDTVSQHKIFSEVLYSIKKSASRNLQVGLGGDVTALSRGIGNDWTVYLKFVASF